MYGATLASASRIPGRVQTRVAREARRRFGRGSGSGLLNFGDCFASALAITTDESLLFKGDDFGTDVRSAMG